MYLSRLKGFLLLNCWGLTLMSAVITSEKGNELWCQRGPVLGHPSPLKSRALGQSFAGPDRGVCSSEEFVQP